MQSASPKNRALTEVDRLIALIEATPVVRFWRDGGRTWDEIVKLKRANPLGLSKRQLQRIYGDESQKGFDKLRRVVQRVKT